MAHAESPHAREASPLPPAKRPTESPEPAVDDRELMGRILMAVQGLEYGSVEIVVHDSRVVQIERREKMRLTHPPA